MKTFQELDVSNKDCKCEDISTSDTFEGSLMSLNLLGYYVVCKCCGKIVNQPMGDK